MSLGNRIVSRGTIRVDARKAVERLREHQLLDLHSHALEALRFALASGAGRIDVACRRDALILTWDGAPLGSEVLERLLDHLLVDPEQQELRRPRWLAYAVNAALGLEPEWVEVHSGTGSECVAVRWTPDSRHGAPPQVRHETAPEGMPSPGMRLEVRRRAGWLARLFSSSELPREVLCMQDSTRLLGEKLLLDGRPFPRTPRPKALLRAPFSLSGARSSYVEFTQWQSAVPTLEWYEQGVRLAASRWSPPPPFPTAPHAGCELPVRVVVDAEELDTNASRSAIRQDSPLLKELPGAVAGAFYAALHALASRVIGAPESPSDISILCDDALELEDALGAAICVISGSKGEDAMQRKLREWLELPLLRNAVGRPLPLAPCVGKGRPIKARYGDDPWPGELGPWVDDVVWLRGRTAEKAIDPARLHDADDRLDRARKALDRRARFLGRSVVGVQLDDTEDCLASFSRAFDEAPWEGLNLSVALLSRLDGKPFVVRAIAEGRLLETLQLDPQAFPLPVMAAVEWPRRVVPRADFDGVRGDEWLNRALWVAALEAVRLADGQASRIESADSSELQRLRPLLRAAVETLTRCTRALGLAARVQPAALESFESLWNAPIWPSSDGGFVSCRAVAEVARCTGAVCLVSSAMGPSPDGRPVLVMNDSELLWLRSAVNRDLEFVPYDVALAASSGPARDASRWAEVDRITMRELAGPPLWMRFECPGVIARIAIHGRSLLTRIHVGQVLSSSDTEPVLGPVLLTIDDDSLVPRASWIGALHFGANPELDREIQVVFAEAVVDCLEGKGRYHPELEGVASVPEHASQELVAWLIRAVRRSYLTGEHVQLRTRVESLPLLRVLDENGNPVPASLYWIRGWHQSGAIPFVTQPPSFATMDWRPVLAPPGPVQDALRELFQEMLVDANAELADRARLAQQQHAWEEWERRPAVDPAEVLGCLPGYPLAFAQVSGADGSSVLTIAAGVTENPPALARVLFRNREVRKLEWRDWALPLALTLGLAERKHMSSPGELSVQGLDAANLLGVQARLLLAAELLRALPAQYDLLSDSRLLAIVASAVDDTAAASYPELATALHALMRDAWWPTAQGDRQKVGALPRGPYGLRYSRVRFAPWHGPSVTASELDAPVAWIPQGPDGDRALALLRTVHGAVEDATAMLSSLQARRAGAGVGSPRLPGSPAHPLLRMGLEELEMPAAQGEMELADGNPELLVTDLTGELQSVALELEVPVRVVARLDDVLTDARKATLLADIDRASRMLCNSSLQHVDELPAFVRGIGRKLICRKLSQGQELEAFESNGAVFPDTAGRWHSVAEMSATRHSWPFTADPPPYPSGEQRQAVLCLAAGESGALRSRMDLRDQTDLLRRERAGELKLQQPPLAAVGIHGSLRSKCLFVSSIAARGLQGEVGLLAPELAGCRGVEVYVGRRLLCTLPDGEGYPILAAVNCDSLVPNRYFDGLRTTLAGEELVATVRSLASNAARQWLVSSRRTAATRTVEVSLPPEAPLGAMSLTGVFWIPDQWPVAPQSSVRSSLGQANEPLRVSSPHESIDGIIPVCAELYVFHQGFEQGSDAAPYAWREYTIIRKLALKALREMLAEAGSVLPPSELEAWQWNMVLLGDVDQGLSASCLDGSRVGASRVLDTLRSGARVALASQTTPFFSSVAPVLLDNGSSACRVLRARARKGIDELSSTAVTGAGGLAGGASSWLQGIGARLALALSGEKSGPADPLESQLAGALLRMLHALHLTGAPVRAVRIASRGRPVRFRASDGALLVNTGSEAVRACLALAPESALAVIGAAALAELNRDLPAVTDREEAEALRNLLSQLASRTPTRAP